LVFGLWSLVWSLIFPQWAGVSEKSSKESKYKGQRPKSQDQSPKNVFLKQNASAQYALPRLIASGAPGLLQGRVQLLPRRVQELQAFAGAKEQFAPQKSPGRLPPCHRTGRCPAPYHRRVNCTRSCRSRKCPRWASHCGNP